MLSSVVFSHGSDEWSTPQVLVDHLHASFQFTLDPCATPATAKATKFFTKADDGLAQSWAGERVFVNPPYSETAAWVQKAYEESQGYGATVVCLVAARTDRPWFQAAIKRANEIEYLPGRVWFGRGSDPAPYGAPFPSVLLVFRPPITRAVLGHRRQRDLPGAAR